MIALSMLSCKKKETHWRTDVLVPILKTEMGLDDIFGAENIASNADQSVSIVIEEDLNILSVDSVIDINDTVSVDIFNVPFTFTIPPGQKVIEKQTISKIDFGAMELTKARAKTANMKFYVTNSIKQPLLVKYELFSATQSGAIYEVEERVEAATDGQYSFAVKEIVLDDYDIDLSGPNHNAINTIYAKTTVWIHPNGDTATVSPTDTVKIVSTFEKFVPDYAYGYLGTQQLSAKSSSAIGVFNNFKSGSFDLENVNAYIDVNNNLGVDVTVELTEIYTKNFSTNTLVNLNHSIVGSSLNIERASESGIEDFPVWAKHYKYDISNSNLDNMLEIMPDSFFISVAGEINPLGNISAGNDFIYFDYGLNAKVKIEIPLNFSATDMVFEDITKLVFDDESVISGALNLFMENGYPFDLDIQFYIIDENNNVVDSLFSSKNTVVAADVDQYDIVKSPKESILKVSLSPQLLINLKQNSNMLIRAKFNSSAHKNFTLYQDYSLNIKIVGDFEYEI